MSDLCIVIEDDNGDHRLTIKRNDKGELHFDVSSVDQQHPWGANFTADPNKFASQLKALLEAKE